MKRRKNRESERWRRRKRDRQQGCNDNDIRGDKGGGMAEENGIEIERGIEKKNG